MKELNFIEKMHKKISKWGDEEVNYSTHANGIYKDLEYKISGNKILDNLLIKGTLENADIILKQTGDVIVFTCKDVSLTFNAIGAGMETVYNVIDSVINIYIEEFKANKK